VLYPLFKVYSTSITMQLSGRVLGRAFSPPSPL
jgi:hypothetical protein